MDSKVLLQTFEVKRELNLSTNKMEAGDYSISMFCPANSAGAEIIFDSTEMIFS